MKEIDDYLGGQGWEWGVRDCIGLLFYLVRDKQGNPMKRLSYIPSMGYEESINWLLTRFSDPLVPYRRLFWDAGIYPTSEKQGTQIILVYGGRPLVSNLDYEKYPIHVVPGVLFQTSTGVQYALMRGGLKSVIIDETNIDKIHRYILPDFA